MPCSCNIEELERRVTELEAQVASFDKHMPLFYLLQGFTKHGHGPVPLAYFSTLARLTRYVESSRDKRMVGRSARFVKTSLLFGFWLYARTLERGNLAAPHRGLEHGATLLLDPEPLL